MGPRSEERGEDASWDYAFKSEYASMGPRSEERGEAWLRFLQALTSRRFNGAALRGARRVPLDDPVQFPFARFNGAALRGARRAGRISPLQ